MGYRFFVLSDDTLQFAGTFGEENIGGAGLSAGALLFGADEIGGPSQIPVNSFGRMNEVDTSQDGVGTRHGSSRM
jgi:hypothetical protein